MADNFQINVTPDKTTVYNPGDVVTLTLSGQDVVTTTTTQTIAISGKVVAADGATGSFGPVNVQASKTTTANSSVKFQSVTDNAGWTWTLNPDGLHATAVVPS